MEFLSLYVDHRWTDAVTHEMFLVDPLQEQFLLPIHNFRLFLPRGDHGDALDHIKPLDRLLLFQSGASGGGNPLILSGEGQNSFVFFVLLDDLLHFHGDGCLLGCRLCDLTSSAPS